MANSRKRPKPRPAKGSKARPAKGPVDPNKAQVGRRPSRPGFLGLIGLMWIAVGVAELFILDASWRFVPAIVFVGIGVFFLRGAFVTVLRREEGNRSS